MKLISVCLATALFFCSILGHAFASREHPYSSGWRASNTPFRVLAVTSDNSSIWACGTDEGIAVSSDGGMHWQTKHQTPDGELLLNIGFANEKFGYATGTGGLILTTNNGGATWTVSPGPKATILQASFADPEHGIVRTPDALEVTEDGGKHWAVVSGDSERNVIKTFPYTFALASLDKDHMAVMLKQGAAQYEPQTFLVTGDAGESWRVVDLPHVTLYSFFPLNGEYWTIGTEVVDRNRAGGGHAVPVALHSADGVKWIHSRNDLSACGPEMCIACEPQGCFSSNGTITNFFGQKTSYRTFPAEPALTTKWAATDSQICFLGNNLECTALSPATAPVRGDDPEPVATSPGPLGAPSPTGPHCISCEFDRILVDPKAQGFFTISLFLNVARDGTVSAVAADGAPTPQVQSRIEQQVQQWIFLPYVQNGVRVNLKLRRQVQISVVHPR